jgi:serine protease
MSAEWWRVALSAALALLCSCGVALAVVLVRTSVVARSTAGSGAAAAGTPYVPHELIVGYRAGARLVGVTAEIRARTGISVTAAGISSGAPDEAVLKLPANVTVASAAAKVVALPSVRYAVPNYIAHTAGSWYPDDVGNTKSAQGWERLQWNFLAPEGIDAPHAWRTLQVDGRAGARGVTIAVLDTGVAYRNFDGYKRSPDFSGTRFVAPCDLVLGKLVHGRCTDTDAIDRNGHGTFVAGMIAEATNNRTGLTGLAYHASVMPVRVLAASGDGNAATIAAGIRYAVAHHARVINLSIEFTPGTTGSMIPSLISAIRYAYEHRVTVVAASGNDSVHSLAYPADDKLTISVGATTSDKCLAYYSNTGGGLDLVAPGGGDDADLGTPNCHPSRNLPGVFQMTFNNPSQPSRFSLPRGWWGTSMASPEVSAAAAMVIASRVLGRHPTPDQILHQLEYTAQPLGSTMPNNDYGYGLLDVAAAVTQAATATDGATVRDDADGERSVAQQ